MRNWFDVIASYARVTLDMGSGGGGRRRLQPVLASATAAAGKEECATCAPSQRHAYAQADRTSEDDHAAPANAPSLMDL